MEKSMRAKKLPNTDSIQELAKFWDTHDLTDFAQALEEVGEPVLCPLQTRTAECRFAPTRASARETAREIQRRERNYHGPRMDSQKASPISVR